VIIVPHTHDIIILLYTTMIYTPDLFLCFVSIYSAESGRGWVDICIQKGYIGTIFGAIDDNGWVFQPNDCWTKVMAA